MKKIMLSLVLLVGCGSDPALESAQKSTKKVPISKEEIHLEKLKANLEFEIEQNKKEISAMKADLWAREEIEYEEISQDYDPKKEHIENSTISTWSPEILEAKSIVEALDEADRAEIDEMTAKAKEGCYKFLQVDTEESNALDRGDPEAEKAFDIVCGDYYNQRRAAWETVMKSREGRNRLLSEDLLASINEYKIKASELSEKTESLYHETYSGVAASFRKQKAELDIEIKEIRARQEQRERDLADEIAKAEAALRK